MESRCEYIIVLYSVPVYVCSSKPRCVYGITEVIFSQAIANQINNGDLSVDTRSG